MAEPEVIWSDDGMAATLLDGDGGWRAHLKVDHWYGDGQREPEIAWVVSWLQPEGRAPYMLEAAVEAPALVADGETRRRTSRQRRCRCHGSTTGGSAAVRDPAADARDAGRVGRATRSPDRVLGRRIWRPRSGVQDRQRLRPIPGTDGRARTPSPSTPP